MLFIARDFGGDSVRIYIKSFFIVCLLALFSFSEITRSFSSPIEGIVKDEETGEPIPFAHIVLGDIVTLTNLDGEFVISNDSINRYSTLQVSVIGYELGNEQIIEDQDFLTIYLKPSTVRLEEVTIKSGPNLMKDVFNRFHLNYEMSRKHLLGYYREDLSVTDSIYYIAEGILDIYVPPNIEFSDALVNPIRTRKKVFKEMNDKFVFLNGNASDMAKSSIWRKRSFLHPKNRANYDFFYAGSSHAGEKDVFTVEFEPKNSKGNTHGKIYIEEGSLAIVKLEYYPQVDKSSFWKDVSWVEEYYEKNGIFELFRVSYTGSWSNNEKEYLFNALLMINESEVTNTLPDSVFFLTESDSFFHEATEDFSNTFWNGYNYIKLDLVSYNLINGQGD